MNKQNEIDLALNSSILGQLKQARKQAETVSLQEFIDHLEALGLEAEYILEHAKRIYCYSNPNEA